MFAAIKSGASTVSWYFKELMGDNDYQKYCAHLARQHPDQAVPTEREYWKDRWARQDAEPQSRCC